VSLPRFAVNPRWEDLPATTALLNGFPRNYLVHDYETTLSIKSVARGEAWYSTPEGRYRVTPDVFLVLNRGQHYAMEVDAATDTETLCPFFAPGFVESAASRPELDSVDLERPVEFCERLYPMTGPVGDMLRSMRAALRGGVGPSHWVEDRFHDLAGSLLALRDDALRETSRFPGSRQSTREELYRRLYRARDFLHSCFSEPVTVADAARVAALSPFHFHRTFREAFGCSPMQYVQARRLEVARRMLLAGEDVTTVAMAVGFESLGSFSALFRRRLGVPPSAWRKKQD
jgi:AraC family transcriptional regulator